MFAKVYPPLNKAGIDWSAAWWCLAMTPASEALELNWGCCHLHYTVYTLYTVVYTVN